MKLLVQNMILLSALAVAGCTTSSQGSATKTELVAAMRGIAGNSLVGAKGATPTDQLKIDKTVARFCGSGVYTPADCASHKGVK